MKSKIINRVRERERERRAAAGKVRLRTWVDDYELATSNRRLEILKEPRENFVFVSHPSEKPWWQFWK